MELHKMEASMTGSGQNETRLVIKSNYFNTIDGNSTFEKKEYCIHNYSPFDEPTPDNSSNASNPVIENNMQGDATKNANDARIRDSWDTFLVSFTNAFNTKDKNKIIELTADDFYAGGGASETVKQWLDSVAFNNNDVFKLISTSLKEGVRDADKFTDGTPVKATGKDGMSGELFFIYKNDKWQFGGIGGD